MKMDKSLFLLLTGTIAGVGTACIIKEAPATNTPATTTPTTAAATTAPTSSTPATATPGTASPGARHVTPHQLGGVKTVPDPNAPAATDAGAPAPTAACLNDTAATSGDCGTISDKSCSWASKRCAAYKTYYKQQVAAKAVTCTLAASANACSGTTTADCGKSAAAAACADANVATACNTLATSCKDTVANCTTALSALNAAGQQAALSYCAKEGGCSNGVAACIEAALFPAAEGGTGGGGPKR